MLLFSISRLAISIREWIPAIIRMNKSNEACLPVSSHWHLPSLSHFDFLKAINAQLLLTQLFIQAFRT
jgi:hypothetical protein